MTAKYLRWTEDDCGGLGKLGIAELLTEVDSSGVVSREIGLDAAGRVVHYAPSNDDHYGLFDLQTIDSSRQDDGDVSAPRFEELWLSAQRQPPQAKQSVLSRLLGLRGARR